MRKYVFKKRLTDVGILNDLLLKIRDPKISEGEKIMLSEEFDRIYEGKSNKIKLGSELENTISFYKKVEELSLKFPNLSKSKIFYSLTQEESFSKEDNILSIFHLRRENEKK